MRDADMIFFSSVRDPEIKDRAEGFLDAARVFFPSGQLAGARR
jgi:hypothetical protein